MPARCSRCDSISPAGPAPTMPTCVRMAPPCFAARMRDVRAVIQGMEAGIFGRFGGRRVTPQASACGCRAAPRGLCLEQQKQTHSWGGHHYASHFAARGHRAPCICGFADGHRIGADRGAERASHLHRRRRDGRRAGQRQEGRLQPSRSRSSATATAATASPPARSSPASMRSASAPSATISTITRASTSRRRKPPRVDLKLRKTEDLAAQMTNAEWINSIPGNDPRKGVFLNCVGCHTLERVMRSKHTSEEFLTDHAPADAELRQPEHPATPAASPRRAADGRARRFTRADLQVDGRLSRHRQSELEVAVEFPARADAPAGRPRHARDLHRVRPAARHHRAPRRDRR